MTRTFSRTSAQRDSPRRETTRYQYPSNRTLRTRRSSHLEDSREPRTNTPDKRSILSFVLLVQVRVVVIDELEGLLAEVAAGWLALVYRALLASNDTLLCIPNTIIHIHTLCCSAVLFPGTRVNCFGSFRRQDILDLSPAFFLYTIPSKNECSTVLLLVCLPTNTYTE